MASNPHTVRPRTAGVQFTKDGPLIPIDLLQMLEDGRLVIFCGAGVSRCCGLPDFRTLVSAIAAQLGRPMEPDEQELFNSSAYDAALGLIENRIGKPRVRHAVGEILDIKPGADLTTHEALLQLATSRQGQLRLVTTNFDRGLEIAPCTAVRTFDYAPYLPLPGTTWSSIVHLHGGLGSPNNTDGRSLILTSADFGRAYLTEGWAGRFLAELFRRSAAILFVGYSVADPAIRYVVDAFAADRADEGAQTAKAYILSGTTAEHAAQHARTWRSRGIEPLTYDEREHHRLLHETLRNCAKRYRMGLFDRTSIILEYGSHSPAVAVNPEATSQITWALRDATGHTGRRFATLEPSPPIEWLDVLTAEGLLSLVPPQQALPAVTWMPASGGTLHPVTEGICRWLVKNLAEPELVHWVIRQGSHLHPDLADLVRARLADSTAPPLPKGVEPIWRFLSAPIAPVHAPHLSFQALSQYQMLETHAWDPLVRDLVRTWLMPTIRFTEPLRHSDTAVPDPDDVASYAAVELVPAAGKRGWEIAERLLGRPDAERISHDLLGELTDLLHRGLTYLEFFARISSDDDGTFSSWPSIDDHAQNSRFRDWTVYIHLLREAWERVRRADPTRARAEVTRWLNLPYPLFRRFVLWAAGNPGGLLATESVEYLGTQSATALWGLDTRRELLQYLGRIGPLLSGDDAEHLCDLVLTGPPRARYRADLTMDEFREITEKAIHLRLVKLQESGVTLPVRARERLDQIMQRHPEWPMTVTEREEFVVWSGPAEWIGPHHFEQRLNDYLDWTNEEVRADLEATPTDTETLQRWRGLLLAEPQRGARVIELLGGSNAFDNGVWALALDHLAGEQTRAACLHVYAEFGAQLGLAFLSEHLHTLTGIIDRYVRDKNRENDDALWQLWDLLIGPAEDVPLRDDTDAVFAALNSPIGHLTEALLIALGEPNPSTYEEIPAALRARLERLLNGGRPAHRHARILLAQATAWLYRLKRELIVPSFLARFDWAGSPEAREAWLGYLLSPGLTPELWVALRPLFLNVVPHSAELRDAEGQFYAFLAFILLQPDIPLNAIDARRALQQGTSAGRSHVAWYWWRQADSATDYGATLYRERLKYLLTTVWPLEQELREEASSSNLACLAIECGTEFPDAVATITPLLTTIGEPHDVLWTLKDKDHPEQHPDPTLTLLDAIVGDRIEPWGWPDLRAILIRLATSRPALTGDPRFMRLDALLHRFE